MSPGEREILTILRQAGHPLCAWTIRQRTQEPIARSTVHRRLHKLVDAGLVNRIRRHPASRFALTPVGRVRAEQTEVTGVR